MCQISIGTLQAVSFCFLGVSLIKIRKHIKLMKLEKGTLNRKMLYLHLFCILFYLAGGMLFDLNYVAYLIKNTVSPEKVVKIHTICNIIEFCAELTVVFIFFEKRKRNVETPTGIEQIAFNDDPWFYPDRLQEEKNLNKKSIELRNTMPASAGTDNFIVDLFISPYEQRSTSESWAISSEMLRKTSAGSGSS